MIETPRPRSSIDWKRTDQTEAIGHAAGRRFRIYLAADALALEIAPFAGHARMTVAGNGTATVRSLMELAEIHATAIADRDAA